MPPIHCTPCRVTYAGVRYQIESNGEVRAIPSTPDRSSSSFRYEEIREGQPCLPESQAKLVRREASRQRRNRNARERHQAMRDIGMTRTRTGQWE